MFIMAETWRDFTYISDLVDLSELLEVVPEIKLNN